VDYKRLAKLAETHPAEAFGVLIATSGNPLEAEARRLAAQASALLKDLKTTTAGFLENCDWYEKNLATIEERLKSPKDLTLELNSLADKMERFRRMVESNRRIFNTSLDSLGPLVADLKDIERATWAD
jgi:uncharacterized protein involved in exopolysaccharide biosynthesis